MVFNSLHDFMMPGIIPSASGSQGPCGVANINNWSSLDETRSHCLPSKLQNSSSFLRFGMQGLVFGIQGFQIHCPLELKGSGVPG